jgi:hypothetical protein
MNRCIPIPSDKGTTYTVLNCHANFTKVCIFVCNFCFANQMLIRSNARNTLSEFYDHSIETKFLMHVEKIICEN